jgi:hypothetical protein
MTTNESSEVEMRRGCRVEYFGKARGPIRDNLDEAERDAARLKLGSYDEDGRFFLDVGAELRWVPINCEVAA